MINNINTGNSGGYLYVATHGHSGTPYINPNSSNPATGMLRMNGNTLEAFDGSCWLNVGMTNAEISLNQSAIVALDWATKKMVEETKIKDLATKNVTVADALARYEAAQEQLKMVLTLTDTQ
jgi:hypothetical protein